MPIVPRRQGLDLGPRAARAPSAGSTLSSLPAESVARLLRSNADAWQDVLRRPAAELRRRPAADRWSPLEYACHVRDVCVLYHQRLGLMLREDDRCIPNWDQDATAVDQRSLEQEPVLVAAAAGGRRHPVGRRSSTRSAVSSGSAGGGAATAPPSPSAGFARSMIHDPVHHLYDVTGVRAG